VSAADDAAQKETFAPARKITAFLSQHANGPVRIVDESGTVLPPHTLTLCNSEAKAVFLRGSMTIICRMEGDRAFPLEKDLLDEAGNDEAFFGACGNFDWDNDQEECDGRMQSCRNCLHRRWEQAGFSCMLDSAEQHGA
jgi:hypothetical protein